MNDNVLMRSLTPDETLEHIDNDIIEFSNGNVFDADMERVYRATEVEKVTISFIL